VAERLETLSRGWPRSRASPAFARHASSSPRSARPCSASRRSSLYAEAATVLRKGQTVDVAWLTKFLGENGYGRAETVMEPGEFAVRGGLFDLFPPGTKPSRCASTCSATRWRSIRSFDPMSQRLDRQRATRSSCCRSARSC
jgi:transcription-repair coupling factor (superfamily II helicase)